MLQSLRSRGLYVHGLLVVMNQLELKLHPKLVYSPENFILHEGVKDLFAFAISESRLDRFSILFIPAKERLGKTHFSLKLALELSAQGLYPVIIEGEKFASEVPQLESRAPVDNTSVFIIDDAHKYFLSPQREDSGAFVHFIEFLRLRKATVIILSSLDLDELPVDGHVKSRLIPGASPIFGSPSETEMITILRALAKQRGIVLRERKLEFLARRLPRDIPSLEKYLDRIILMSDGRGKALRYSLLGDAL